MTLKTLILSLLAILANATTVTYYGMTVWPEWVPALLAPTLGQFVFPGNQLLPVALLWATYNLLRWQAHGLDRDFAGPGWRKFVMVMAAMMFGLLALTAFRAQGTDMPVFFVFVAALAAAQQVVDLLFNMPHYDAAVPREQRVAKVTVMRLDPVADNRLEVRNPGGRGFDLTIEPK